MKIGSSRESSCWSKSYNQRHAPNLRPQHPTYNEYLEDSSDGEEYEDIRPRRVNRPRDRPRWPREEDGGLGGVKVNIPSIKGKSDPEAYLEWEMHVEQMFSCHNYSENKKLKLTALEFTDYALVWWDQMQKERVRNGERPITTWEEMRAIMRRRFVPSYYRRELHNHLQRLTQGSKSVDEYYKEMEIAMIRTNIMKDNEATMARFLHGLNRDIANVVEMHHYVELEEMVHQAIKVEQQLKRRGLVRRTSNSSTFGQWKNNPQKDTLLHQNLRRCFKCQGRGHIASECPNRRTMIFNNHGELETEGESTDKEESSQEDGDGEYAEEGEALVTRRALSAQMLEKNNCQRENLFHTRCQVQGKDYEDVFPDEIPSAYRTNSEETKEIQRQIQEWMTKGYVRESLSPCAVSVLLVPKKDSTWRMCVDCRAINNIIIRYRHPIPGIDDMLDELKNAFKTKHGLYEWSVMPFELSNAPRTFMRLMNDVL
ncbi:UNVERIFIED_CONTAM: Transposon Ty3-G Gag-Pol polyprotein [Sesamum latifolium]|uniref:Transposon Ty3-G Gag-Pol polyprotein n=1 Tax=Sesamum latifolium TaxID=2727402 RepID=A0AAW2Y9P3_9LAMI